ncbi:MAG: ribosome biogenesis GTP-binding protein YihA/YsxC [Candidatus Latescibacteria bacterium]|jgi:GTP-binding protein|nr:ribosome biogenesis GTP-binding protein YihA/YsxC [Candidatus Latescibacterota bacterium]
MKFQSAEFVTSVGFLKQLPRDGFPEIAFAGRSNVGKSSLLNKLFNRKNLAKTSGTPGKTRTLNYYRVNDAHYFVDLPGYGYAKRSQQERQQWGELIEGYVQDRDALVGFVQLIDARHDPTRDDLQMLDWLVHTKKPFVVVATKADKLSGNKLVKRLNLTRRMLELHGDGDVVPFSAVTGRGKEDVWRWIGEVLDG